jgi:hypothetical protein
MVLSCPLYLLMYPVVVLLKSYVEDVAFAVAVAGFSMKAR